MVTSICSQFSQNKRVKVEKILCYTSEKDKYAIACLIENDLHFIVDRTRANDSFERALTYYTPTMTLVTSRNSIEMDICDTRQQTYEIRPAMEFEINSGKDLLRKYCNQQLQEQELIFTYDQVLILQCFSGLFQYLASQGIPIEVDELLPSDIDTIMLLNRDAFHSLDVFELEQHPNPSISHSKESFTLFGLFNRTCSSEGYKTLYQWFNSPSSDKSIILNRQSVIEQFLLIKNQSLLDKLIKNLHLKSPLHVMDNITPTSSELEWKSLLLFCESCFKINQIIFEMNSDKLHSLVSSFDLNSLKDIRDTILKVINFESSKLENRTCVASGLDEELDQIRHQYDTISSELTRASEELLTRYVLKSMFPTADVLNVVYFPQLGFLTCLTFHPTTPTLSELQNTTWDYQFSSENGIYFKNDQMKEMDEQIGDIQHMLIEKEIDILYELIKYIRDSILVLKSAQLSCGVIDALASLSICAKSYNLSKPTIVDAKEITFTGGRHLLQEMCVDQFVTNSFSTKSTESAIVITGPNNSGKSVLVKQIGCLALLTQIGSYVPCQSLTISLFDRIITRIKSVESVSRQKSSFMIDLQQIGYCIRNSHNSLLLIDEFGKGTRNQDGVGLLASSLQYLVDKDDFGFLFAITHHLEIYKFLIDIPISFYKMIIVKHTDGTLTYMYTLEKGLSDSSYGVECAMSVGMPSDFISAAKSHFKAIKSNSPITLNLNYDTDKEDALLTTFIQLELTSSNDIATLKALIN